MLQHRLGVVYPSRAELASLELDLGQVVAQNFHVDVVAAFELAMTSSNVIPVMQDAVRQQFVGVLLRVSCNFPFSRWTVWFGSIVIRSLRSVRLQT
ncbi:MAG: hypothetical protein ACLRMJ_05735 [Alistipes finegoldii]